MNSLQLLLALPARPEQILAAANQAAPSLIKLLHRGQPVAHLTGLNSAVCQACGIKQQQDWPLAPICAAADGLPNTADGYWLRLDPVHLEVVMGGLLLRPPISLQLAADEASGLIADINLHWQRDGLSIQSVEPSRWYLRLADLEQGAPNLRTTPLDQMSGEYLTPNLPRGADARLFLQRINEVQMLLHTHPVNLARESAARPVINGLWLWGGGTLAAGQAKLDLIAADTFECRAVARHAGIQCTAQPKTLGELPPSERALVVLTQPDIAWDGDLAARLAQLEQDWFQPLLQRLNRGGITQLRLEMVGHRAVTLTPLQSWRLWR
jgi:hypothetical protein